MLGINFKANEFWKHQIFSLPVLPLYYSLCSLSLLDPSWLTHLSHVLLLLYHAAAAAAKPLQSCPTLCDPRDGSPPGSPVPGILQARTLEWVAISFSNAWKWKVKVKSLSRVWLLAIPWTAAHQAPPSMGFSRQEYWSGVPVPSPWSKWMLFPFNSYGDVLIPSVMVLGVRFLEMG